MCRAVQPAASRATIVEGRIDALLERLTVTVEIKVGPEVLTINRGSTFLVSDMNGEIDQMKAQGVFSEDTRFISTYQLYINEQPWERVTSAPLTYYACRLELTNPEVLTPDGRGKIEARTLALTLDRQINSGLREHFFVTNYSQADVDFVCEVVMRSDFADIFQVKAGQISRRGEIETVWNQERCELITHYRRDDFFRRVVYRVEQSRSAPHNANGRLAFHIQLKAGATWEANCEALLEHQPRTPRSQHMPAGDSKQARNADVLTGKELENLQQKWTHDCTELSTLNESVRKSYAQSVEDMGALRMPEHDLGPNVWVPAAGVPWFVTLFGRDSLIASYQNMALYAPFANGALRELARYQAQKRDDWRDAQPGKILHELRHGELAFFHEVPFTPYYGTADSTILYLIVLHETWKWTGDRKLLEDLRGAAERCLEWIDHSGDLDGDGFQEWKTFSNQGFNNMAWKDSGTSIVYRNGAQTQQPKGTCELQGYVFDAKIRTAEVFDVLGDREMANRLRREAAELQRRFDEKFWMEDEGCYALGIDAEKRLIDAVASNTGQCLWSGIVPPERAPRIVKRLLEDDMWCGWGIRTLSSKNPSYNPYSYQNGSVWPHDNSIIAAGFKRYGFHEEANSVAEGIFAAASYFDSHRLPEVFSGLRREPESFPSQYIGANIPQAWAAGSIFHLLRTMLGLRADAPNQHLYVNPRLPDWLGELELRRLKVGKGSLDLRFWREGNETLFEVIHHEGERIEVRPELDEIPTPVTNRAESGAAGPGPSTPLPARAQTPSSGGSGRASPKQTRSGRGGSGKRASSTGSGGRSTGGAAPQPENSPGAGHGEENPIGGGRAPAERSQPTGASGSDRPQDSQDQRRAEGTPSS
jgi:glycogen debranching enzyme